MGFIGSLFSNPAKKAAKAQIEATKLGIEEQRRQFDLSRADLAPWREAGGTAITGGLAMLQPGYDYTTSPGYQFRFGEGQRAVESSAASKGMLMSGGTFKDLTRFGQGVAADDYNDQFNRYMAIAGGGQQAATSGAQLGQQSANSISELYSQMGNAKASGYGGSSPAGSALGSLAGTMIANNLMSIFASDRRLKTNIRLLRREPDGLGWYEFSYKAAPEVMFEGVMADEVKELRPAAYVANFRGDYAGVNYAMLGAV